MGGYVERLKAKLGPLPVWAWGLIIGAIVLVVVYMRSRNAPAIAAGDTANNAASASDLFAAEYASQGGGTAPIGSGQASEETAESWITRGSQYASSNGYSAVEATAALKRFIDGYDLSAQQKAIIDLVIGQIGFPPGGVSYYGTADTPAEEEADTTVITSPSNKPVAVSSSTSAKATNVTAAAAVVPTPAPTPAPKPVTKAPSQAKPASSSKKSASDVKKVIAKASGSGASTLRKLLDVPKAPAKAASNMTAQAQKAIGNYLSNIK